MTTKKVLIITALVVVLVSVGSGWYFFIKLPGDIRSRIDDYFASFPAEVTAKYRVSEINVFQRVVRISNLSLFDSRRGYSFSVEELTLSQGKSEGPVTVFDMVATNVRGETEDNELYSSQTVILTGVLDPTSESRRHTSITGPLVEYFAGLEFESLEILGSAFSYNNGLPVEGSLSSLVFEKVEAKQVERVVLSSLLLSLGDGDSVRLEISTGQATDIPLLVELWSDPELLLEKIGSITFGGISLGSMKFKNDEVELSLDRFALGQVLEQRLESISVAGLSVRADDGEFGSFELGTGEATDIPLLVELWSDPELFLEEIGSITFGGISLASVKFKNDEVELSLDRFALGQVLEQRLESISVAGLSVRADDGEFGSFELGTGEATDIPLLVELWSDPELLLEEIGSITFGGISLASVKFKNDEVELSLDRVALGQVLEQRLESISVEGLSVRADDGEFGSFDLGTGQATDIPLLVEFWSDPDPEVFLDEIGLITFGGISLGSMKFKNDEVELSLDRFALGQVLEQRLESISVEGLSVRADDGEFGHFELGTGQATDIPLQFEDPSNVSAWSILVQSFAFGGGSVGSLKFKNDEVELSLDRFALGRVLEQRLESISVEGFSVRADDGEFGSFDLGTAQATDIPLLMDFWSDPDPNLLLEEIGSISFGGGSVGSLKFKNDEVELSLDRFALGQVLEQRLESISVEGFSVRADDGDNTELLGKSLEGVTVGLVKLTNVPMDLQGMQAAGDDPSLFARHLSEGIDMTLADILLLVDGEKHSLKEVKLSARSKLLRDEFYYISTLSLDMVDLSIRPSVLPPLILEQLGELEKTSVGKISVGASASVDHDERTVRYDMYVAPKNLGRLDLEIEMGNVPESLFGVADQDSIMDLMSNFESLLEVRPTKVLLRFVDDGLVTVGLEQFARQSDLEVSEALEILANLIRAGSATANDPAQIEMGEELIKFIGSPNAVSIVAEPPEPITLNELFEHAMTEPDLLDDLLGLRVVAQ